MSITLATIRTQVRSNLDEPATDAADWSDAELNRLINQWYHQVVTAVMSVYEDYYITKDPFNITANKQEYTTVDGLPSDIFKIRRLEVNYDPTNANASPTRLYPVPIDAVRQDLGLTNSGVGVRTQRYGNYYTFGFGSTITIGLAPIPATAGTAAGNIWYIPTLADLSSDASVISIPYPERYYNIITDGATGSALAFGQQDTPEAARLKRDAVGQIALMQEELEDKIAEPSKFVIDSSGEDLDLSSGGY